MKEIIPLVLICLVFAYLSHRASPFNYRINRYQYRERFFYTVVVILAVGFAGLRRDYNDTYLYILGFENLDVSNDWFSRIDWTIGEYPLFRLLNCLLKIVGLSSQSFVMVYSALTIGIYLWFIRKYSNNILLSVFLFFSMGIFVFSLAAMKQCVATAFCLVGIDRLLRNRKLRFLFWTVIGMLFHPFAAMFLVCPLLTFSPWTIMTSFMIAVFAVLGYSLQQWLGNAISFLSIVGVDYDISSLSNESVNIFRFLVVWSPVILSFVTAKYWRVSRNKAENLMLNLSMLCAELMIIALFGNPIYFGRLANYFLIFQAISLPIVLSYFEVNSRLLLNLFIVIGYTGYFVYGNTLNGRSFDNSFSRITLWKYLSEII